MKKNYQRFCAVLLAIILSFLFVGCSFNQWATKVAEDALADMFEHGSEKTAETEKMHQELNATRLENAGIAPKPPSDVSNIRMTILERHRHFPPTLGNYEYLTVMQICYGYCADGTWYDYPSENFELKGILNFSDYSGWRAAAGSHITKIGTYLIICVTLDTHPLMQHTVSDSLNSDVTEPFKEYYTYRSYYDETGSLRHYGDEHDIGYGYIAENLVGENIQNESKLIQRPEFPARYYIILDYTTLADDYVLNVSVTGADETNNQNYSLTGVEIKELIEG